MSKPRNISRVDLAEAVRSKAKIPTQGEARFFVDAVLEEMATAIIRDGRLVLSSFGTFKVRAKPIRVGRNPRNGDAHPIPAMRSLTFKASRILRKQVTDRASKAEMPDG